jgi:streptogramin lyase
MAAPRRAFMLKRANRVALAAVSLVLAGSLSAQSSGRTVWEGIYTEAQAARGVTSYAQYCGFCHGMSLDGTGEAPVLSGAAFLSAWNGLNMGQMYERVRMTMPFDRPNSLSREVYADIVAYMLKHNGFPAGERELTGRPEMLSIISISDRAPAGGTAGASALPAASTAADGHRGPNDYPNPYRTDKAFFKLPAGRTMGSTSAVATDSKGNIWVADRCGVNSCADSEIDPIMMFDPSGRFVRAFGGGRFNFPHGFFIDAQDNIWLTDQRSANGKGGTVTKFSPSGAVLMVLGKPGISGRGTDALFEPNGIVVAADGSIFVVDGHTPNTFARVVKFDAKGKFIKQWGTLGDEAGQLNVPHAIAIDSQGRLFVADRWNNRVQIYDQEGNLLNSWTQFGRPSGLYIDKDDILYSADSESRAPEGYGHNPGWKRGIRIGSVRDGIIRAFIPDPNPEPDLSATSSAEGIWVDRNGVVYGAQVREKLVARHTK